MATIVNVYAINPLIRIPELICAGTNHLNTLC